MPAAIGLIALQAIGFTGIAGLGVASTTIFGVSLTSIVGTALLAAVLIGVQYALKPDLPKPQDGHQSVRQNIPVCQYGYGRTRVAGSYMLYETSGGSSIDVVALLQGQAAGFVKFYLNDDQVIIGGGLAVVEVVGANDGRYNGSVTIETRLGRPIETAYGFAASYFAPLWSVEAHQGHGIASLAMECRGVKQEDFQKRYPSGLPNPSAVLDFPAIWDPRDPAQDPDNPATWVAYPDYSEVATYGAGARVMWAPLYGANIGTGALYISRASGNIANTPDLSPEHWIAAWTNPVLQLIDFLTDADHGMGISRAERIDPVIDDLMAEADLCDELMPRADGSFEPRYRSDGFFLFETDPAQVLASILASCDGYMAPNGDGALALTVGVYRAPTVPTLQDRHVVAIAPDFGQADEEHCNELTISYTSPLHKYKTEAGQAWRDEEDITTRGKTRSQALNLPWVQSHSQARRLAKRTFSRLNSPAHGTMTCTLYALSVLGSRWVRLQYPDISGLEDVVIEITGSSIDFAAGKVNINWCLVNPNALDAWDPLTEEGDGPPFADTAAIEVLPVPQNLVVETGGNLDQGYFIHALFDDPGRPELSYALRYRILDDGTGNFGPWIEQSVGSITSDGTTIIVDSTLIQISTDYGVQVASVGPRGSRSDWSEAAFVVTANAIRHEDGTTYRREDGTLLYREDA